MTYQIKDLWDFFPSYQGCDSVSPKLKVLTISLNKFQSENCASSFYERETTDQETN